MGLEDKDSSKIINDYHSPRYVEDDEDQPPPYETLAISSSNNKHEDGKEPAKKLFSQGRRYVARALYQTFRTDSTAPDSTTDQRRALRQEKATDDVSLSTVAAAATTKPSTGTARAATQPPAATEPPATTTNSQDLIQISESVWRKGVYSAKKHPEKTRAILANTTRRIEDICERIEATFTAVESFPQNEPVPTETAGPKTKESSVQSAGRSSIGSQPPPVVLDPKPRRHQRSSSPTAAPKLPSVVETPGFHPLLERSQAPQTLADEELLAQAQDLSKGLTDQESILLRSLENDKTGKARLAEPLPQTPLRGKADYGVSALQKSPGRASTSSTPGQGLSRQRLLKSTSMRERL